MFTYHYHGPQGALRLERKTGWASGRTDADKLFVHGGPMAPDLVLRRGLSPEYAREYIVAATTGNAISGGKMLFSFLVCAGNQPPTNAEKPAAVGQLWGFDGQSYVFRVPQGTTFWCQNADIQPGREVAFEYVIESTDIV